MSRLRCELRKTATTSSFRWIPRATSECCSRSTPTRTILPVEVRGMRQRARRQGCLRDRCQRPWHRVRGGFAGAIPVRGIVTGTMGLWGARPSRLAKDPEQDLNDLVRRMAQGDFDYDLLNYDVDILNTRPTTAHTITGRRTMIPGATASVVRRTMDRPSGSRSPSVGPIGATTTTRTSTPIIRSTTRSSTIPIITLRPIIPATSIRPYYYHPYGYRPYGGGGYGPYRYGNSYTPYPSGQVRELPRPS